MRASGARCTYCARRTQGSSAIAQAVPRRVLRAHAPDAAARGALARQTRQGRPQLGPHFCSATLLRQSRSRQSSGALALNHFNTI